MKRRIGLWMLGGVVVACVWVVLAALTGPNHNFGRRTIAAITAPASLLGLMVPLAYYWFILLNAAIYALVGLVVEASRHSLLRCSSPQYCAEFDTPVHCLLS